MRGRLFAEMWFGGVGVMKGWKEGQKSERYSIIEYYELPTLTNYQSSLQYSSREVQTIRIW